MERNEENIFLGEKVQKEWSLQPQITPKEPNEATKITQKETKQEFILTIGCLEFVDDVLSSTEGIENQHSVLKKVDEFAVKNKLQWGESKCQVMQVGVKVDVPDLWELGEKRIGNTTSYKYLGETITNDNKNKRNIEIRENTIQATIRQINTTASSDIMRGIETKVLLDLYETCVLTVNLGR